MPCIHALITNGMKSKFTGKPFYLSPERAASAENTTKGTERRTWRLQLFITKNLSAKDVAGEDNVVMTKLY
jgi:hypothetical protein